MNGSLDRLFGEIEIPEELCRRIDAGIALAESERRKVMKTKKILIVAAIAAALVLLCEARSMASRRKRSSTTRVKSPG